MRCFYLQALSPLFTFLIVMATICPIILNTAIGVMDINPQWIKMALNQGANNVQLIQTIVIPYSIPHMMTSIRFAMGIAWIVLVPAEFLGVSSGLGYLINDARDTMEYDKLMAVIIAIGILGFILDRVFQKMQHRYSWAWAAMPDKYDLKIFCKKVRVNYPDLSRFAVGSARQLICRAGPWLL